MDAASPSLIKELRPKIIEKRARLRAVAQSVSAEYVSDLLAEVDEALERIESGSYGICEICHEAIEADCLERNPLARFCLDHLSTAQRRAHEQDLELATRIQSGFLPARDVSAGGWRTHFRYQPAGAVGGDYCEILPSPGGGSLFFALGDVAGKGIAASLLMAHLSAIFRSLMSLEMPLAELMFRANRLFCESTPATHFATLVAARATETGVDLCNAGHCRPLVLRRDSTERIDSTGLPLGLFCEARFAIHRVTLDPGDSLVLYSDGIVESQNPAGQLYEEQRLVRSLRAASDQDAARMADHALQEAILFCDTAPQQDDMTLLIVRRDG